MGQILSIISFVNQLFPLIVQIIKQVEDSFPEGGMGSVKSAVVLEYINEAAKVSNIFGDALPALTNIVTPIINGIVSMFNVVGAFKTSGTKQ